ncbi:MAG: CvpA family protein, partial [Pirellulaceae bacterium]|nr:CvpA family protein [Pirellulaceae bacterium]
LVGTTLFGFWKGMAWQLASLASVVVSALVALRFNAALAPKLSEQEPWNLYLASLILFLATGLAIWVVFRLVARFIDRVKLKEFDHQVGALFGLAKGVLFCILITFFVVGLSESARQRVLDSRSGHYIALLLKNATPVLPVEITNHLGEHIEDLQQKLDPETPPAVRTVEELPDRLMTELNDELSSELSQQQQKQRQKIEGTIDSLKEKWEDFKADARQ